MSQDKTSSENLVPLTKKDFETDQLVKWCPGCGDHSVLATVQKFLATKDIPRENHVFVSGIGCSSRLPYYMNTYGFHSIHGRAPAVATGIKLANPQLNVWVITGDGDALSIGGNHIVHLLRRNVKMVVLLLNNRIYGLTKGQYSPTSDYGQVTKSSPFGAPDRALRPICLALGAEGTFVARTLDLDTKLFTKLLDRALEHNGTSFIEVYQSCAVFNTTAFDYVRDKTVRKNSQVYLEHGKPLVFGENEDRGLRLHYDGAEVVTFDPNDPKGAEKAGVTVFDETNINHSLLLTKMEKPPIHPVPVGVFYKEERETLEETLRNQYTDAVKRYSTTQDPKEELRELFNAGTSWEIAD
jgi:2-oxoglutarate ferredoxin oxidoreductase subunit beta